MPRKRKQAPPVEPSPEIPVEEVSEIPKRSPFTKRAILVGCIIGALYSFIAIYISLKTGIAVMGGTVLVGYILLSIRGKYDPGENVVATSIAEGSILVGMSVIASLPAIVIYAPIISQRRYDWIFYLQNVNPPLTTFIFGTQWYDSLITPQLLITIGIFAGVAGLFMLLPFREQLLKLAWPQQVPIYRTIEGMGDVEKEKNRLLKGMGIAAAYTGTFTALGVYFKQNLFQYPASLIFPSGFTGLLNFFKNYSFLLPQEQQTAITFWNNLTTFLARPWPAFLGVYNSPLSFSVGYFLGWKRAIVIFAGSIWSIIVWIIWEGSNQLANYGNHFMQPMLYYASMGVLFSYIAWEIFFKNVLKYREDQKKKKELREQVIKAAAEGKIDAEQAAPYLAVEKVGRFAKIKQSSSASMANFRESIRGRKFYIMILSVAIFAIGTIIIFNTNNPISRNIWGFKVLDFPWYLTLASSPLLAFSGWWFTTVTAEAGASVNYLTDSIVVPAILLLVNFPSIIIFTTILSTWQQSAGRYVARVKVGRVLKVKDRVITKSMLVGIIFGAFVSAFIIMQLYSWGGFGTATFPAPTAQISGLLFMAVVEANSTLGWASRLAGFTAGAATNPNVLAYQYISNALNPWYLQSWFVGTYGQGYGWAIFGAAGFAIGLVLARYNWSPISLAVGLLLPPYISATMFCGGILNYYVYRKNKADQAKYFKEETKYQNVLAGVATGDGVAQIAWILAQVFLI